MSARVEQMTGELVRAVSEGDDGAALAAGAALSLAWFEAGNGSVVDALHFAAYVAEQTAARRTPRPRAGTSEDSK